MSHNIINIIQTNKDIKINIIITDIIVIIIIMCTLLMSSGHYYDCHW